jgi:hypothetical protein
MAAAICLLWVLVFMQYVAVSVVIVSSDRAVYTKAAQAIVTDLS